EPDATSLQSPPHEWHDTLCTILADLGFRPSSADPSMFVRRGSTPFFILVYVDDLVVATADTVSLAEVKFELQKRHTYTDLGELHRYLGLQITRDRAARTITPTQSHMVQQVLQRFGLHFSTTQPTPLPVNHRLTGPFPDEPFESNGPYAELVGCLIPRAALCSPRAILCSPRAALPLHTLPCPRAALLAVVPPFAARAPPFAAHHATLCSPHAAPCSPRADFSTCAPPCCCPPCCAQPCWPAPYCPHSPAVRRPAAARPPARAALQLLAQPCIPAPCCPHSPAARAALLLPALLSAALLTDALLPARRPAARVPPCCQSHRPALPCALL
ncbi:unnamed protein product, partial [Closterium sp. NIES-53]